MKQTLTLVALGAFLAIPAVHAQDNPKKDAPKKDAPGKDQPTRRPQFGIGGGGIAGLDQLDLTAEQKEKVAAIQKSQAEKMQALYANQDTPREERATKMRELREATTKLVKAILTKEQSEKFDKIQAAAPAPGAGGFGGGFGGGTRGGGIGGLDQLNLTAEQKTKVEAIQKEQREKMQALFQDQNTPREERSTKMRELMQATQTQIDAVLTADQKKKQEELRKNAPQPGPGRRPGGKTNPEKT